MITHFIYRFSMNSFNFIRAIQKLNAKSFPSFLPPISEEGSGCAVRSVHVVARAAPPPLQVSTSQAGRQQVLSSSTVGVCVCGFSPSLPLVAACHR